MIDEYLEELQMFEQTKALCDLFMKLGIPGLDLIVYKDGKCGLYDCQADSLVTALKYDALSFGRTASEQGMEFTIWVSEMEDYEGMIAIESTTNEPMEIMFPKRRDSTED